MVWGLEIAVAEIDHDGDCCRCDVYLHLMSVPVSASVVIVMTPCACVANVAPSRAMAVSSLFISF